MSGPRIPCCIPFCGRTEDASRHVNVVEIMCAKCWKRVTPRTKVAFRALNRRYKAVDKRMRAQFRLDPHKRKRGIDAQAGRMEELFEQRRDTIWRKCKEEIMGI